MVSKKQLCVYRYIYINMIRQKLKKREGLKSKLLGSHHIRESKVSKGNLTEVIGKKISSFDKGIELLTAISVTTRTIAAFLRNFDILILRA